MTDRREAMSAMLGASMMSGAAVTAMVGSTPAYSQAPSGQFPISADPDRGALRRRVDHRSHCPDDCAEDGADPRRKCRHREQGRRDRRDRQR